VCVCVNWFKYELACFFIDAYDVMLWLGSTFPRQDQQILWLPNSSNSQIASTAYIVSTSDRFQKESRGLTCWKELATSMACVTNKKKNRSPFPCRPDRQPGWEHSIVFPSCTGPSPKEQRPKIKVFFQ
jgi:hypothetical protein